jgi:hypothetical protein
MAEPNVAMGRPLDREELRDARTVIHNYADGESGIRLSRGCAEEIFAAPAFCTGRIATWNRLNRK